PEGIGYAPHVTAGRMGELAALINAPNSGIQVSRGVVDTHEIFEATDPTEWGALTAGEKQRYQGILSMGTINVDGANVGSAFAKMFGAGTTTRTALVALRTRDGSRAEQVFAPNIGVSFTQIAEALRS
ncbi:hypothetical protein LCGC14_3032720, partial [marine sediment metagenome]